MIQINVETRRATVAERELLTSGSVGIEAQFNFSEDWDELSRVAVFRYSEEGTPYSIILDSTNIATVPAICLEEDGEPLFIGAYGADASGNIVIPTIWVSAGVVRTGVETADVGTMPEDPDSFWVQVLGLANTANDTANAANTTAADAHALATNALTQVSTALDETAGNRQAAETARGLAESARDDAIDAATEARSWAIGNTGSREGEDTDNAKYYAEQAQATLDEAVTEINTAKIAAITDVQSAGTTQVGLVNSAGTTQIGDVNTAGANQISAVNDAGNTQKNAVIAEGTTQVAAVRTEGATQRDTLQPYATQAAASASAAAQSETNAAGSATAAAGSATNAASSAAAAQTAQTGAEAAQSAAEAAQSAAETAASSVSASAAQIAKNTTDIASLDQAITDLSDEVNDSTTGLDTKAPAIINTASGAIASFSDGADSIPVKQLVVAVEPAQDLHGYDSPWPAGGGKNLLPQPTGVTANGLTTVQNADGSLTISGTATGSGGYITDYTNLAKTIQAGETIVIGSKNNVPGKLRIFPDSGTIDILAGENSTTHTLAEAITKVRFYLFTTAGTQYNFTIYPMVAVGTDSTFAPYSNECPISGWTGANVTKAGKNILSWFGYTKTGWYCILPNFFSKYPLGTNLTFSIDKLDSDSHGFAMQLLDANESTIGTLSGYDFGNTVFTRTWAVDNTFKTAKYFRLAANWNGLTKELCDAAHFQIEIGTTRTSYEAPASQISVTFPSSAGTVYGGTLTVNPDRTGQLVVDRAIDTFSWGTYWSSTNLGATVRRTFGISKNPVYPATNDAPQISNIAVYTAQFALDSVHFYCNSTPQAVVFLPIGTPDDTQVQVCYTLAEPVVYSLTESEISGILTTLYGTNNIWADCGDTEVTYAADTKLYIEQLTKPTEDDMTADHAISAGTFFQLGNTLYLATSQIAAGATITPGTNATQLSLADALNTLNS